jgi:hypothetical protein
LNIINSALYFCTFDWRQEEQNLFLSHFSPKI